MPGTKASIIATPRGNIGFSCFENARPLLSDSYKGSTGTPIVLRPDFVASVVPGSLHVFSLVAGLPVTVGAQIKKGKVWLLCNRANVQVDIVVAGIHLDFPDWDLPHLSDEQRIRSRRWWSREWVDNPS